MTNSDEQWNPNVSLSLTTTCHSCCIYYCCRPSKTLHGTYWQCWRTHTQQFYGSLDFVHLSWLSIIPYLLPPSITIHGSADLMFYNSTGHWSEIVLFFFFFVFFFFSLKGTYQLQRQRLRHRIQGNTKRCMTSNNRTRPKTRCMTNWRCTTAVAVATNSKYSRK